MSFNFDLVINSLPLLLAGAVVTVKITIISVAIGIVIGLFVGIARVVKFKPVRWMAAIYVDFIRGTPLLVQIFIIYFALPLVFGIHMNPFVAAISACGINSGAYVAEIFRAGIQAVDEGQIHCPEGYYTVFFPSDVHRPLLAVNDKPIKIRKVVVKVHVSLLGD